MSYWPHLFNKPDHSTTNTQEGSLNWEEAVLAQQRYWNEWMEAGQLWMSWWVSTLPSVGWPPAGVVLPPSVSTTGGSGPHTGSMKPAAEVVTAADKPAARKPRAPVVRHH